LAHLIFDRRCVSRGHKETTMAEPRAASEREQSSFGIDETWLQRHREEIIEPNLPIVDPHHHLWDRGSRYLLDEFLADIGTGHNIRASVFMQCDSMYRADDEGIRARTRDDAIDANPHPAASGDHGAWLQGWRMFDVCWAKKDVWGVTHCHGAEIPHRKIVAGRRLDRLDFAANESNVVRHEAPRRGGSNASYPADRCAGAGLRW
jgi:hypothetical protein